MEIMNFKRLLALALAASTTQYFAQYNLFGACIHLYTCYDYMHLDNLSDISAYRNRNVQQYKMQIP